MGPLTQRIRKQARRRRAQVIVTSLMRRAEAQARIAAALSRDEQNDGGLLIHRAIEAAEAAR